MPLHPRSMCATGVQIVLATNVALTQVVMPRPALAQAEQVPMSIAPACFTALDGDVQRDGRAGRLLELRAEMVAETANGVLVFLPTDCMEQVAVVPAQPLDANALAQTAVDNVRDAFIERGASDGHVNNAFRGLETTLDIQDFGNTDDAEEVFDNFARSRADAFKETGDESTGNSALAAIAVVGCIAMTGGAACAFIPALLGGLFGTDVTTQDVETAVEVVDSMRQGRPIPTSARDHLRRRGIDEGLINTADAFAQGDLEDVIVAVGGGVGLNAREIDVLEAVVRAARSGALSCRDVREAAQGRINRPLQLDSRARRDLRSTVARALAQAGGAEAVARSEAALVCLDQLVER